MAELAPPGVQVVQEFTAASPSIVTPALMPCIIGPCKQIVEALNSDGSINSDARITLPAFFVSTNSSPFTALGGKKLKFQYKGYAQEEMTFAADPANPTADQVVEQINTASLRGLSAVKVTDGATEKVMVYTTVYGTSEYFRFITPSADSGTTIFGCTVDIDYFGYSNYMQYLQDFQFFLNLETLSPSSQNHCPRQDKE